jgi:Protein of unknown function (DUF998)
MTPTELQDHIYKTYFLLRIGLCLLALVFPFLLWGIGSWNDISLQNSISEYYFAFAPPTSALRVFAGRLVFVGVLFVLGFFLMLYRGFSRTENWALNIAGLCAVVVVLFPTETPPYCTNCGSNTHSFVHYSAAVVLFVCIAFVAWACTEETLVQLPEPQRRYFRMGYYAITIIMLVTPGAVIVMTRIFGIYDKWIFIVETVGTVMFSEYWGLKSYELSKTEAEKKAMKGARSINVGLSGVKRTAITDHEHIDRFGRAVKLEKSKFG